MRRFHLFISSIVLICAPMPGAHATDACAIRLRFIGAQSVAAMTRVDGDLLGGISGLDYDAELRQWRLLSDDRNEYGPARFFTARFDYDRRQFANVMLRSSYHFAPFKLPAAEWIDAESVRIDRPRGELLVASEGDAQRKTPSWIRRADRSGRWLGEVRLPPSFAAGASGKPHGARPNRSIEGLAFTPDYRALWIALEAPLLQDGEPPTRQDGADVRLTRMQWPKGATAQYVYRTDPIHANGTDKPADHGITEILASGASQLLVLERSGIRNDEGSFNFHTRLYCADASGATDVASFDTLVGRTYVRMNKRLLFDFDHLHDIDADNLEAMSWGPQLARGHASLVLASDNNFFTGVATRLLLFEAQNRALTEKVTVRGAPMK